MSGWSKSKREISEKVDKEKDYPIEEAINLLKELSKRKFKESFDVSINLGVDPKKSDQVVRGATNLPHGNGKEIRVAVIAQGSAADQAKEAGAVGSRVGRVRRCKRKMKRIVDSLRLERTNTWTHQQFLLCGLHDLRETPEHTGQIHDVTFVHTAYLMQTIRKLVDIFVRCLFLNRRRRLVFI